MARHLLRHQVIDRLRRGGGHRGIDRANRGRELLA